MGERGAVAVEGWKSVVSEVASKRLKRTKVTFRSLGECDWLIGASAKEQQQQGQQGFSAIRGGHSVSFQSNFWCFLAALFRRFIAAVGLSRLFVVLQRPSPRSSDRLY